MWEKCPICSSSGKTHDALSSSGTICRTCNGKGIISKLTGLPPSGVETFASPKYRDINGFPITPIK